MGTYTSKVGVDILSDCNCRGFSRTSCPKTAPPPVLLSREEQKIWDESEPIHDQNTELVQAILAKYGFTEVTIFSHRSKRPLHHFS